MDIEEEIRKDIEDNMDIYSDDYVDELIENGEVSAEEAAFMRGYNKSEPETEAEI